MENNQNEVDRIIGERFSALRPDGGCHPDVERGFWLLRQKRLAARGRKRRWACIAAGAAAACLPIMAFPVTRALAQRCVSACVVETAAVRHFLLGKPATVSPTTGFVKPTDRAMAPDFTLNDAEGEPIKLSAYRGTVVLLNFWATWCVPCRQEIPWFVEFQRSNRQRGFAVLGVSMDEGGWRSVRPFLENRHVNYPVMIGSDEVAARFGGLDALPLTLIIDRSGRVATVHAGLCTKEEYERDINSVLNERQTQ